MSYNVGVDLLHLRELDRLMRKKWFIRNIYHIEELNICADFHTDRKHEFLAGRFCAKEAVYKAIGGIYKGKKTKISDILILRGVNNNPIIKIKHENHLDDVDISVSISHKGNVCIAVALWNKRDKNEPVHLNSSNQQKSLSLLS